MKVKINNIINEHGNKKAMIMTTWKIRVRMNKEWRWIRIKSRLKGKIKISIKQNWK